MNFGVTSLAAPNAASVIARWNIARGLEVIELMRARWPEQAAALRERLALGEPEVADWRDAVGRILIGFDPATGLYEQFAKRSLLLTADFGR
jgi:hypothetical protein